MNSDAAAPVAPRERILTIDIIRGFALLGILVMNIPMMQSLICLFIFCGWGLGFWGKIGWAWQFALGFAIFFLIQVPLSVWWFRHSSYGPMEYLWRVLTYGHRPPAVAVVPAV